MGLDFQEAVHRLESCESMKNQGRDQLLLGSNGQQAVPGLNPNRITPEYLEPYVVELQRVVRQLEEIIEEYGEPGDNLIGEWYWSGVDDLKRLRARATYYRAAIDHAKALGPTEQRTFLYENVFLPIFYGSRHRNLDDPGSPWIHGLADYCEPARLYKNYVYAVDVNDAQTGLGPFLDSLWESVKDFFHAMEDITESLFRGGAAIVEGVKDVAKGLKKFAMPVGILLAGIGIFIYARQSKARG